MGWILTRGLIVIRLWRCGLSPLSPLSACSSYQCHVLAGLITSQSVNSPSSSSISLGRFYHAGLLRHKYKAQCTLRYLTYFWDKPHNRLFLCMLDSVLMAQGIRRIESQQKLHIEMEKVAQDALRLTSFSSLLFTLQRPVRTFLSLNHSAIKKKKKKRYFLIFKVENFNKNVEWTSKIIV